MFVDLVTSGVACIVTVCEALLEYFIIAFAIDLFSALETFALKRDRVTKRSNSDKYHK